MVTRLEVLRVTRFLWARKLLQQFGWKALDDPRYSPNLATSEILRLNGQLDRTLFHLNENVQCAVVVWVMQRTIRASGKDKLKVHCDKCLNRYGDCAET
jgi:hypothetical protein